MRSIAIARHLVARSAHEAQRPRSSTVPPSAAPRRIVAFLDRSPDAANAAWRAGLVARERGLPLQLVHMQPLHDDLAAGAEWADAFAADLRETLQGDVSSRAVAGSWDHEGLQAAQGASLLVVPSRAAGAAWPLRSPVLRILGRARAPVLVARLPADTGYRRVLAAVELDLDACSLVAAAHALAPEARLDVLHVLDTGHEETMRLADVPERTIRAQRKRDADRARAVVADLIAATGAQRDGAAPVIAFGGAARQVLEQQSASGADLVVMGKRPRPALLDAVLGRATQRVLDEAAADVLVLPLVPRPRGAAWERPEFTLAGAA